MIRFLSIRNLAVIDALEVEFNHGLNVLTGETGAGKSILVEAVGLLVGGRASPDLVRTGEDTAAIQAIFEDTDGRELIVRREISAQGRSRTRRAIWISSTSSPPSRRRGSRLPGCSRGGAASKPSACA
jgi:DNA repair protein RecN (Recombination protein N)